MKRYRLAVCKGPDCTQGGAHAVFEAARAAAPASCRVYRGGCYGLCHLGPNVVLREERDEPRDPFSREDFQLTASPFETYYWHVTPQGISRIIEGHVVGGRPQQDMIGDPAREAEFRNKT